MQQLGLTSLGPKLSSAVQGNCEMSHMHSHASSILLLSYLAGCFEARSAGAQLASTSHYCMLHGVAEYCVGNFNIQKFRLHGSLSKKAVRLCTAWYLRLGLGMGDRWRSCIVTVEASI